MNTPENTTTKIDGRAVTPEPENATAADFAAVSPNAVKGEDRAAKLQAELDRQRDEALRTRADFDNTRKRLQREKEEGIGYANARLLERLLPVLDNFEMGMTEARKSAEGSALLNGMSMVQKQIEDFLKENGVQPIDAVGQKFDPNLHEALGEQPSEEQPEGHVVMQTRRGYKLRERLLRPANVFVSKGKA